MVGPPPRAATCLAVALALAMSAGPTRVAAAPATEESPAELFRQGQGHMDAADYTAAIEAFESALRNVGDDARADQIRNRLRVELVRAHRKAHSVDGELTHLNKAKVLLADYRAALGADQSENLEWARQQEAEIDAQIEEAEVAAAAAQAAAAAAAADEGSEDPPPPQPSGDPTSHPGPAPTPTSTDNVPASPPGRPLIIAGGALAGLGLVGGVLMAVGFSRASAAVSTFETEPARRDQARDDNRVGNAMGIAGAVSAGVLLTSGGVLIALGVRRDRARRVALVPSVDPTGRHVGVHLGGRF